MPITFRCAECSETYDVEDGLSDKTIRCRECQGWNRVPFLPAPKATPSPPAAPVPKPHSSSSHSFTKGLLAGAILMGVTSAVGLWLGLASRKDEPPQQTASPQALRPHSAPAPQQNPAPAPVAGLTPGRNEVLEAQWKATEAERQRQAQQQIQLAEQQAKERAAQEEQRRQAELQAKLRAVEQAAQAAEKRHQEKLATEFALLSPPEQETVRREIQKLRAKMPPWTAGEIRVLERYWIFFDNDACRAGVQAYADAHGFTEFCDNLALPPNERSQLLTTYLFKRSSNGNLGGYTTALAISRAYKKVGLAGLPSTYKRYISDNRDLFAFILK